MKFIITNGSSEYKTGLQYVDNNTEFYNTKYINKLNPFFPFRSFRLCVFPNLLGSMCINETSEFSIMLRKKKRRLMSLTMLYDAHSIKILDTPVILSNEYSIEDLKTIIKFNIKISPYLLSIISMYGNTTTLNYLQYIHNINWDNHYEYYASTTGNLDVLQWFTNNKIIPNFNVNSILIGASEHGHIHILNWIKQFILEFSYDNTPIHLAILNNHINVLEWWKNSGLPIKCDKNIVRRIFDGIIEKHSIPIIGYYKGYYKPYRQPCKVDTLIWLKNNIPYTCECVGSRVRKYYRTVFTLRYKKSKNNQKNK